MMQKVDPKSRLTITNTPRPYERFLSTQSKAADPTVYEPIIYKCAKCSSETLLEEKSFKKHSGSEFSNLLPEDRNAIILFLKELTVKSYSFLDFYCPGCKKTISIFYTDGYGGKSGDYIIDIDFIVENEK